MFISDHNETHSAGVINHFADNKWPVKWYKLVSSTKMNETCCLIQRLKPISTLSSRIISLLLVPGQQFVYNDRLPNKNEILISGLILPFGMTRTFPVLFRLVQDRQNSGWFSTFLNQTWSKWDCNYSFDFALTYVFVSTLFWDIHKCSSRFYSSHILRRDLFLFQ